MMKKLNQIGDTIVEVLLSLTVLAMVIGIAYGIANRSVKRAQQAQERTQATKLVEGQLDRLKYLSESQSANDVIQFQAATSSSSPRCLVYRNSKIQAVNATDSGCTIDSLFKLSFTYEQADRKFTVSSTWDSLVAGQTENVTMEYRTVK